MTIPYVRGSATSQAAAESMAHRAPTVRARVYAYLLDQGERGATDEELIAAIGQSPSTTRPRRRELEEMGAVIRTDRIRTTASGRSAAVYVAVPGASVDHQRGRRKLPPGAVREHRIVVNLTDHEAEALERLAASRGLRPVGLVRDLIEQALGGVR